jgi:hypothetical protein
LEFFPVQNSNPEPMIAELEKIIGSGENGLGHDVAKFVPVARMNAILVVTVRMILHVVPRINANGNVRLDFEQEISEVSML